MAVVKVVVIVICTLELETSEAFKDQRAGFFLMYFRSSSFLTEEIHLVDVTCDLLFEVRCKEIAHLLKSAFAPTHQESPFSLNDAEMDAATLLDQFTHNLANIPDEAKYILSQLREKDIEYDKVISQINSADSQLFKYIKQHGSLVRHPKEDMLTEEITKNLEQARKIQSEKILLANTALLNISKHALKFETDIKRLVDSGAIENWDVADEDIEMVDYNPATATASISIDSPGSFDTGIPPISNKISNEVHGIATKLSNSSIENKPQRPMKKSFREKTPTSTPSTDESAVSIKESTPNRRRDVAAGTIIKGLNRRMLGNGAGLGSINENGGTGGDDDELYCFCQQVSYGAMVACDNPNCKYEWFHYDCVGLKEPPVGVWYCPECRKDVKKDTKREKKKKL